MAVVITGNNTPTAGGVTYGDGTTYATTAAGTSGQVLTSAGSSAPTWASPAAGGSWIYLSTVSASGAATADVETTFNSTYDAYAIVVTNMAPSNDTVTPRMRLKIGGSYQSGSYEYHVATTNPSASTYNSDISTSAAQIVLGSNMSGVTQTGSTLSAVIYINNPASTTKYKNVYWNGSIVLGPSAASYHYLNTNGGGLYYGLDALTGVRFFYSAGNISGTFRLYGIKNS